MTRAAETTGRAILDTSGIIATDVPPVPGVLAIRAITVAELRFGVMVAGRVVVTASR